MDFSVRISIINRSITACDAMKQFALSLVLAFCMSSAYAQKQRVGNWYFEISENFSEAFTANDSGSTFGFLCTPGNCFAYLDTKDRCTADSVTPILINAESGSNYVDGKCFHFKENNSVRHLSIIQDADVITAISTGSVIGFAMPMASGQFKVVRFGLNGAMEALQGAAKILHTDEKQLRDSTL